MIAECPTCQSRYDVTGRAPGTRARCRCGTIFAIAAAPAVAGALSCPQCGGAADPSRPQCPFCRATLALVACPSCFGMIFGGSKHCSHCGTRVDSPASPGGPEARAPRRCPVCQRNDASLVARVVGDVLLDECPSCAGVFVDATAFERLVQSRDRQATLHMALAAADPGSAVAAGESVAYRPCPDCKNLMNRANFGRRSGVIVDTCRAHGVWFDADELRRVVEFVMAGGLDEARKRELEDMQQKIRQTRRDAAFAEAQYQGSMENRTGTGAFGPLAEFLAAVIFRN